MQKQLFYIEVTDTFGGDANYSWVTRHIIAGSTLRGAVNRFSRLSGMKWHSAGCGRYDSKLGSTCFFIDEFDPETAGQYRFQTDDRN